MKRFLLLVAACGGPPTTAAAPAPPPRAVAAPPISARALPGYPPPLEPRGATCVITGAWSPEQPHELRFRRGGRTFATVNHVDRAALSLGEEAAGPFVELWTHDVHLWGSVVADQILLHPSRALLFDGYLLPGPTALLRWLGAAAEPVPVGIRLPDFVEPASPPRDDLRCADLTLDEKEFEPRSAVDAPDGEELMLAEQKAIPLSRELHGPPAAVLRLDVGGSPLVEVIERRGDRARIVVKDESLDPGDDVLLVGWVQAGLLAPRSHGFGGSWGSAGEDSGSMPRPREGWRIVTCPHEVPLVVELEGERHLVGAASAGVRIELPPDTDKAGDRLVETVVRSRQIQLADDTRLLVKGSAVTGCAAAGPER